MDSDSATRDTGGAWGPMGEVFVCSKRTDDEEKCNDDGQHAEHDYKMRMMVAGSLKLQRIRTPTSYATHPIRHANDLVRFSRRLPSPRWSAIFSAPEEKEKWKLNEQSNVMWSTPTTCRILYLNIVLRFLSFCFLSLSCCPLPFCLCPPSC